MGVRRSVDGNLLVFLILLSPMAVLPLAQVIGPSTTSTEVKSFDNTLTYTSSNVQTQYGTTQAMISAETAFSFQPEVIGVMAPQGKCAVFSLPVTVKSGTSLNIEMTSNQPANFYLFPSYPSAGWPSQCAAQRQRHPNRKKLHRLHTKLDVS